MDDRLSVGLAAWIIQDGNYGDFECGQRAAFALEFYALEPLSFVDESPCSRALRCIDGSLHEVCGQIVRAAPKWWVIDAGVLLFQQQKPPAEATVGRWLTGTVEVGIDPFFYFEKLAQERDAPALIYDWQIDAIKMQTAPFIDVGPRLRARDPARLGWQQITETRAWKDDGGHADYLLHVHRLSGSARRTREPLE